MRCVHRDEVEMRLRFTHWSTFCYGRDALLHLRELGDKGLGSGRINVRDFHLVRLAHFGRLGCEYECERRSNLGNGE